jgi:hypothetical protein
MLDFDFDTLLLVMSQRQLIGKPARDWSRPISKGQFPFPLPPSFGAAGMTAGLKLARSHTVPTSSEASLASNLFDVATQPKHRETVVIDHSLAYLSPVPSTFSLISPPGSLVPVGLPWAGSRMPP